MLSFPCYEVNDRFDHGMSGGIVVDELGSLCGLIRCSLPAGNPEDYAVNRVKTLWPTLRTLISADRDGHYPKGVTYPMIDLALHGLIGVTDLALLDPRYFPGRVLPQAHASEGTYRGS
jgi:hypothetical protein